MRSGIVVVCLMLQAVAITASMGQDTPDPADESKAPAVVADYKKAFDMLIGLGLPDAAGATYVELELHPMRPNGEEDGDAVRQAEIRRQYMMGMGDGFDLKTRGNAWLLPGGADGKRTLITGNYNTVEVINQPKRNKLLAAIAGPRKAPKGGGQTGDWKEAEVEVDVDYIIAALEEKANDNHTFDLGSWEYSNTAADESSKLLVLACHLHRSGHEEQAAKLAQKILSLVPDPVKVIDGVVDSLGKRVYEGHVEKFFETQDWKAFGDGLGETMEKFPRGWSQRVGVTLLRAKVEERIKGAQPQLSKFEGVQLDADLVQKLDALLVRSDTIVANPLSCWLIELKPTKGRASVGAQRASVEESQEEWMRDLCANGMDGFITVASALADEVLIPARMSEYEVGDVRESMYPELGFNNMFPPGYGSSESLESMAISLYEGLDRPCTRGEITKGIVLAALPGELDEFSSMSAKDLQEAAHAWWKEHSGDSQSELARHYLDVGDSEQRGVAVEALIQTGSEADAKRVEEFILSASPRNALQIAETYLKARRGKAAKFFEDYSKLLKEQVAAGQIDAWYFQNGGVEAHIKKLSVYVNEVKPEKVMADLKAGKMNPGDAIPMLQATSENKLDEYLPALISAIRKQDDFKARIDSFGALITWSGEYQSTGLGEATVWTTAQDFEKLMLASKGDWEFFLSETVEGESDSEISSAPSRAHHAAWVMEVLYFPEHSYEIMVLNGVVGYGEGWEIVLARWKKFIETGQVEEFPKASQVDEERRQAIREELKPLGGAAVVDYYDECPLIEKLAWDEIIEGFGDEMPSGVSEVRMLVTKCDFSGAEGIDQSLRDQLETVAERKHLSRSLNEEIVDVMLQNTEASAGVLLLLYGSETPGRGMQLRAWTGLSVTAWKERILPRDGVASVTDGEAAKMAGVALYQNETGEYDSATLFEPAGETADGQEKIKEISAQMIERAEKGIAWQAAFFAETTENLNKPRELEPLEPNEEP